MRSPRLWEKQWNYWFRDAVLCGKAAGDSGDSLRWSCGASWDPTMHWRRNDNRQTELMLRDLIQPAPICLFIPEDDTGWWQTKPHGRPETQTGRHLESGGRAVPTAVLRAPRSRDEDWRCAPRPGEAVTSLMPPWGLSMGGSERGPDWMILWKTVTRKTTTVQWHQSGISHENHSCF